MADQILSYSQDYYVYLHRRATDNAVFYVGKGKGRRAWNKIGRTQFWKHVAMKHGVIVEIKMSGLQEWYALEVETELIAYYGRENLCNLTDGGEGTQNLAEESLKRKSAALKRSWVDPEIRERRVSGMKVYIKTEDHRQAISNGKKGKKHNAKQRAAFEASREKRAASISASQTGIRHSEERRREISELRRKLSGTPIMCVETGRIFSSRIEAGLFARPETDGRIAACNIGTRCQRTNGSKFAYGYTWEYANKSDSPLQV